MLQGQIARARTVERRAEINAQLRLPPFPNAVHYLWTAFWEIRGRRGGNGFAAAPISWPDLDAYCRLTGTRFAPWELRLITALDDLWLARLRAKSENEETPS